VSEGRIERRTAGAFWSRLVSLSSGEANRVKSCPSPDEMCEFSPIIERSKLAILEMTMLMDKCHWYHSQHGHSLSLRTSSRTPTPFFLHLKPTGCLHGAG